MVRSDDRTAADVAGLRSVAFTLSRMKEGQAKAAIARQTVCHEVAVPRFEDVQGLRYAGEEHEGERKYRKFDVGHVASKDTAVAIARGTEAVTQQPQ